MTVLMLAAQAGNVETVQLLLAYGAEVNSRDTQGRTALMEAAARGHSRAAQVLLDHDADVDGERGSGLVRSFFGALRTGFGLLDNQEASDSQNNRTPLMMAASGGHPQTIQVLVHQGADVDIQDSGGSTALMLAAGGGYFRAVEVLLEAQAEIDKKDRQGRTALMLAGSNGHSDIVASLLPFRGARPRPSQNLRSGGKPIVAAAL